MRREREREKRFFSCSSHFSFFLSSLQDTELWGGRGGGTGGLHASFPRSSHTNECTVASIERKKEERPNSISCFHIEEEEVEVEEEVEAEALSCCKEEEAGVAFHARVRDGGLSSSLFSSLSISPPRKSGRRRKEGPQSEGEEEEGLSCEREKEEEERQQEEGSEAAASAGWVPLKKASFGGGGKGKRGKEAFGSTKREAGGVGGPSLLSTRPFVSCHDV